MKRDLLFTTAVAVMTVLQSCNMSADVNLNTSPSTKHYNICLIIDGTDRFSNQNDIPYVSVDDMKTLAKNLCDNGKGTIYVSYVDKDCDNNKVAIFDWRDTKPADIAPKLSYQKGIAYQKEKEERQAEQRAFEDKKDGVIGRFAQDGSAVETAAYANSVAKQRNGSDVNGAINKAIRLLRASEQTNSRSYIILVSDGCDNVGKQLQKLPDNTELFIVNANVSKHHYGDLVSKEFVTLKQVQQYIFTSTNF